MNRLFITIQVLWLLLAPFQLLAQAATSSNTYALVVGISIYEKEGIPTLRFAHRDAELFAEYLKSAAGGSVPQENIQILLNKNATSAAVLTGLKWLLQSASKDDKIYFYFSGHGDTENETAFKDGFLLSYNTPRNNYVGNAVSIDYLNKVASTLSTENGAQVVLITDACRSGKLAGSRFNGNVFTAEQLRLVRNNEVRLASCLPEQLSQEDESWGDGRGVFSWYLLNGLKGGAAKPGNKTVSLNDMQAYLQSALEKDPVLKQKNKQQTPVTVGNPAFTLALINANPVIEASVAAPAPTASLLEKPVQNLLYDILDNVEPYLLVDFAELNKWPPAQMPHRFVSQFRDFLTNTQKSRFIYVPGYEHAEKFNALTLEKVDILLRKLQADSNFSRKMADKLVVNISNRVQNVINYYLEGDAAEMEKRYYYSSKDKNYGALLPMLYSAYRMCDFTGNAFLQHQLNVKYHYFSGVVDRLGLPLATDFNKLLAKSLEWQTKALALEPDAPYIQNELGVIFTLRNELDKALNYFYRAADLAPDWSIPFTNIAAVLGKKGAYDSALVFGKKALLLQPNYTGANNTMGGIYLAKKNYLFAEEYFKRGIFLNSRYYYPFERLGELYTTTLDYNLSDSMYFEAEERKKGYRFYEGFVDSPEFPRFPTPASKQFCLLKYELLDSSKMLTHLLIAIRDFENGELSQAEYHLKKLIQMDSISPLGYHLLAVIFYQQNRLQEAEPLFSKAQRYYKKPDDFMRYYEPQIDAIFKREDIESWNCAKLILEQSRYIKELDYFYAGAIYEKWNYYDQAINEYRKAISHDPNNLAGYYKTWRIQEVVGKFDDALKTIMSYEAVNKHLSNRYQATFYYRMIRRFPDNGYWHYRAGNLYYQILRWEDRNGTDRYIPNIERDELTRLEKGIVWNILPNDDSWLVEEGPVSYEKISDDDFENGIRAIPGTQERIKNPPVFLNPFSNALTCFKRASALLENEEDAVADIAEKLGDVYYWNNQPDSAIAPYQRALYFKPQLSEIRGKLINASNRVYRYQVALAQLDSLHLRNQLSQELDQMYGNYLVLSGRYTDATKILNQLTIKYSDSISPIQEHKARLHLYTDNLNKATQVYHTIFKQSPGANNAYTLARIYAMQQNKTESYRWLDQALAKGFKLGFVLKYDPVFGQMRGSEIWQKKMASVRFRRYEITGRN